MKNKMKELFPDTDIQDGFVTIDGSNIRYLEFNTVNTQMLSDSLKDKIVKTLTEVFNTFSGKLKIRSINIDYDFENNLDYWNNIKNSAEREWEQEFIDQITINFDKYSKNKEAVRKKFIFMYELKDTIKFEKEEQKVISLLSSIGTCSKPKAEEIRELFFKEFNGKRQFAKEKMFVDLIDTHEENLLVDNEEHLPCNVLINTKDVYVDDNCVKTFGISNGKEYVEFADIFDILQKNKNLDICINIFDTTDDVSVYALKREEDKILADIKFAKKKNDLIEEEELSEKRDEIKEARNNMNKKGLKIKKCNIFFIVKTEYSNRDDDYNAAKLNIESQGYTVDDLAYEQRHALVETSIMNFKFDHFFDSPICVTMTSNALSALYPFKVSRKYEGHSASILGTYDKDIFLYDPAYKDDNRFNKNAIILGQSGSGKSTVLKSILIQEKLKGRRIFLIDPEEEFAQLCKHVDGKLIDVNNMKINILEVRNTDSNEGVEGHISVVLGFLKTLLGADMNENLLSKVILKVYKDKGIDNNTDLNTLKSTDYPIFDDVFKVLFTHLYDEFYFEDYMNGDLDLSQLEYSTKKTSFSLFELENHLLMFENLTSIGVYGKWFNGHSNFNAREQSKNSFLVFSIRRILESKNDRLISALYFSILTYIEYMAVNFSDVDSYVVADEAHLMLRGDNKFVLNYLVEFSKRLRKRKSGLWLVTQDIDDFIKGEGKDYTNKILSNSSMKLFMKLDESQIRNLELVYQSLTETDKNKIFSAQKGEALLVDGIIKYFLNFTYTSRQLDLISLK